jgi:acetyl esterase/lipase
MSSIKCQNGNLGLREFTIKIDKNFKLRPIIIFLHGGSWRAGDKNDMTNVNYNAAIQLAAKGFIVANANHRLAPSNKIDHMISDSSALISWWHENAKLYGGRIDQFVLVGYSSGAHLLSLGAVASTIKPCAFVGISGLFNPEEFISSIPFTMFALKPSFGEKIDSLKTYSMVNVKIDYFPPTLLLLSHDESLRVRADNTAFAKHLEKMKIKVQIKDSDAANHYDQMLAAGQKSSFTVELISNFVKNVCNKQSKNGI